MFGRGGRVRIADATLRLALVVKGVDAVLELAGGLLLAVVPGGVVAGLVRLLTQHELHMDPHDFIATHVRILGEALVGRQALHGFAVLYLLGHGAIKLLLVLALLRRVRRLYPAAIGLLVLFVAYQLYLYGHSHATALLVFAALDAFIAVLAMGEYGRLRSAGHSPSP